jgi:hypothetical protein
MRLVNPTVTVASAKTDGLFEFRRSSAAGELVKVMDGKVWVYNGTTAFVQVGATAPFTAGRAARAEFFRDNAFIHDGDAMRRYNGTALFSIGQVAPTAVTNMTAQAPAGAGVSGTFEAEYFWYDPTTDHEAGPSAVTGTVVLVNQARRHTQPTGVPAAQYTQWRAYVRRTDTNETKFMRVGTWNLASGTHDEETLDAARVNPAALVGENDPPAAAFAILKEWKGYFIGVEKNSSDYVVSKLGDAQSYPPRFRFSVRKGDGEYLSGVKAFGEEIWLQKPHRTWRLEGDQPPFKLKPVHSSYGGVSQESGSEVDGRLYDWDRERGPYVTDGVNFAALGDATIQDTIDSVNRAALADIRCVHIEGRGLILWAVATGSSTRKRMILAYDYLLGSWLPPWTGLEYASLATFTNAAGDLGAYMGDYWGRVFELFSGDRDGLDVNASSTDLVAVVTSASANTVTAAAGNFPTTGSGLVGLPVAVRDPGGNWQWRRIASNTSTVITLDTTNDAPWDTVPAAGWRVVVGGIEYYWRTPVFDEGTPHLKKTGHFFYLQGKATSGEHRIEVHAAFNDDDGSVTPVDFDFMTSIAAAVWGESLWGVGLWGSSARAMKKKRIGRSFFSIQMTLSNFYPDQPIIITAFGYAADRTPTQIASVNA